MPGDHNPLLRATRRLGLQRARRFGINVLPLNAVSVRQIALQVVRRLNIEQMVIHRATQATWARHREKPTNSASALSRATDSTD